MKAKIGMLLCMLFGAVIFAQAQQGMPRKTVEERLKMVDDKLVDWKLDKDKQAQTDSAFATYFRAQDKARDEMKAAGGQPDWDKVKESMKKLADERDEKLKKIWTDDQFKQFKSEIEPALRPQRPAGAPSN